MSNDAGPREARCSVCSAKVRLRLDGTLRFHLEGRVRCDGSQRPPRDLSAAPLNDLMSIASLLKIGVYEALAKGANPENLADALQETFREIRMIAARAQDQLDAAKAEVQAARKDAENAEAAHLKAYMQVEERVRAGLAGIVPARIAADGFDPHGYFVYFLWGADAARPLYVGKSSNLLARLGTHLSDSSKRYQIQRITMLRCESELQMDRTEMRMIQHYQPPLNTIGIRA